MMLRILLLVLLLYCYSLHFGCAAVSPGPVSLWWSRVQVTSAANLIIYIAYIAYFSSLRFYYISFSVT